MYNEGHFAKVKHFTLHIDQQATDTYANLARQRKSVNGGLWSNVEMAVQMYALETMSNMRIITGGLFKDHPSDNSKIEDVPYAYFTIFRYVSKNHLKTLKELTK